MPPIQTTTTRRNVPYTGRAKPFAWSYSKLKNYEVCPKRHYHIDIAKDVKEEESEQLAYGNLLHKALAEAITHVTSEGKKGAPLPKTQRHMQLWVDKVTEARHGNASTILVEQQLAITKAYGPTEWFGDDVWYRGIADVIKIMGPVALVLDWKTGKILEDGVQLALMAQCVFAHHPGIQKIRTEFIWLKEEAVTRADFTRADMVDVWNGVLPRVAMLENAAKTTNYPATPNHLCNRWCPVTQCPHSGRG